MSGLEQQNGLRNGRVAGIKDERERANKVLIPALEAAIESALDTGSMNLYYYLKKTLRVWKEGEWE